MMDHAQDLGIGSSLLRIQESKIFSNLSLLNCRHFSVGCTHFPHVQFSIPISQYKVSSKKSRRTRRSRYCTISVIKSLDSRLKWLISSDFSKSFSNIFLSGWFWIVQLIVCFFATRLHLFNGGVWNAWDSKIYTITVPGPHVLINFVLTIIGFSRVRDKYILLSVLRVRHQCYARWPGWLIHMAAEFFTNRW